MGTWHAINDTYKKVALNGKEKRCEILCHSSWTSRVNKLKSWPPGIYDTSILTVNPIIITNKLYDCQSKCLHSNYKRRQ
jgi:hypothetical protein